jgi:hypothetical protein
MMSLPEIIDKIAHLEANIGQHNSFHSDKGGQITPIPRSTFYNSGDEDEKTGKKNGHRGLYTSLMSEKKIIRNESAKTDGGQSTKESSEEKYQVMINESTAGYKIVESPKETMETVDEETKSVEVKSTKDTAIESDTMDILGENEIKKTWPEILQTIRSKRISIASYLLEGEIVKVTSKCIDSEDKLSNEAKGSVITLGFAKKFNFHKEALEYLNNRRFVEKIASEVLGQKIQLELIILEDSEVSSDESELTLRPKTMNEGLIHKRKKSTFYDPIIQSAVEIFNGKIINGEGGFSSK